ncbi:MAG: hypothetical protein M1832_002964 [Thelocarpon impressellum]|nr:MAG: hypothetical protein M1832_002964 [Thelocarpon impressellum]
MVLSKDQLEARLHAEHEQILEGRLKDDNPLDVSPAFMTLCEACRRGDLKACQEMITEGANINARDQFDYTPLILIPADAVVGSGTSVEDQDVLSGIEKLSRQLEIRGLWDGILEGGDRRIARQRRTDEVAKGRDQLDQWYRENVLKHKFTIETKKACDVRWDRKNAIFADVLLQADEDVDLDGEKVTAKGNDTALKRNTSGPHSGIPVGPRGAVSRSPSRSRKPRKSTLFPVHRAMLLRSEFFLTMFSSSFKEAQSTQYLQVIPVDCSPDVLEVILTFLYTEKADISLDLAIDVLFAADQLMIEKLKAKAAVVISTLGSGNISSTSPGENAGSRHESLQQPDPVNIYDVLRAGWLTRVHRLEEFAARYLANRLEHYIDEEDFAELIMESASRITKRQETDSIELLDDIRYYLSERFRLRFEDSGIDEIMNEKVEVEKPSDAHTTIQAAGDDEAFDVATDQPARPTSDELLNDGRTRTLDGALAGDEFASDAINYQILVGKIDGLLERLKLDA